MSDSKYPVVITVNQLDDLEADDRVILMAYIMSMERNITVSTRSGVDTLRDNMNLFTVTRNPHDAYYAVERD